MEIILHRNFLRKYVGLPIEVKEKFKERRNLFIKDKFHPLLNNHSMDIQSAGEAGRIAALLKDIENTYLLAQENLSETRSLEQGFAELHGQYKKASISESGFGSFEEVKDAQYEAEKERILLGDEKGRRKNNYFGLGRFLNKEKIREIEQKIESLQPKISELGALKELGEEQPKGFYEQPVKEKMRSGAKEICEITLDKIWTRHEELLKGITFEEPALLLNSDLKEKVMEEIGVYKDESYYQDAVNIIQNSEAIAKKKAIIDSWWDILGDINDFSLPHDYDREWKEREGKIKIRMDEYAFQAYKMIRNSKEAEEIIGDGKLREADDFLTNEIVQKLLKSPDHTTQSNELGRELLNFISADTVPIILLNSYRESGHSGERPFLSTHKSSRESKLFKVINSLSEEQLKVIDEKHIPGFSEILHTIKENPNTFNSRKIENEVDNPQYAQIQGDLIKMSEYYLKSGDKNMQFFLMDLLEKVDGDLGDIYGEVSKIVSQRPGTAFENEVIDFFLTRGRQRIDEEAIKELLENFDAMSKNAKEKIQKENYQIISFLLKEEHPDPVAIEKTSRIVGIEKGELEKTLQFINELREAHCYSSVGEESDIYAYRDLYKKSEELSARKGGEEKEKVIALFIKRIREAEKFLLKYGGTVDNAESLFTFTEIPDDTRLLIKELHEDFNYRVSSAKMGELSGNNAVLNKLLTDKKLAQETAKDERGEYEARVLQEVGISFLYEGNIAHDLLENLKEKGWITIQTYNRLYAARRAFTCFESYAYSPRQGEKHPTINVSFYGNMFSGKEESLLEGSGTKDENGFLHNGSIGGKESINIYAPNFEIYREKLKEYQALDTEEARKLFLENFRWSENQPTFSDDPEYKKIEDISLPIGVAPNGHTRFYATPYGIVSGCVSQGGIFEAESQNLGVWLVTGHKEMLRDFIKKQEAHKKLTEEIKKPKVGGFEIEFENTDIPRELKEAVLPANISVGEFLLNLHFEQYLHKNIVPRKEFLKELMQKFDDGELAVMAGGTPLTLDDKIPQNVKIRVVGQEESLAKAA